MSGNPPKQPDNPEETPQPQPSDQPPDRPEESPLYGAMKSGIEAAKFVGQQLFILWLHDRFKT